MDGVGDQEARPAVVSSAEVCSFSALASLQVAVVGISMIACTREGA